jgi:transcriptional regulator with XRE-family HTH domain
VFLIVDLGEKIKSLRKSKNMTQKDLADRIGVSKSIISSYESGIRYPSYDVLVKMARIFHVSTDYLLGIEKKRVLDASALTDDEIEAIKNLIMIFIENRKRK